MGCENRRGNFGRALVTGGAGFVGAHLVRALALRGTKVVVADYQPPNVASPLHVLGLVPSVDYLEIDLTDRSAVARAIVGEFGTIFHLAAQPIGPISRVMPDETTSSNVDTTRIMLDLVHQGKARQLILASSACAFGVPKAAECPLQEDSVMSPGIYPYTNSKQQAERLVREAGGRASVARFVNVFGEADWHRSRIVPRIAELLLAGKQLTLSRSNGRTILDFLHVSDAVAALLCLESYAAQLPASANSAPVFNFGSGKPISVLELIKDMCITFDGRNRTVSVPASPVEPEMHKFLDSARAKDQLGWTPQAERKAALRQTIKWYARHGSSLHDVDGCLGMLQRQFPAPTRETRSSSIDPCVAAYG